MKIIAALTLLFTINIFPQLEAIKEFPRAYDSQEIKELTPVWISENEILVFYTDSTTDTIFSRRSLDKGQTWSQQEFEQIVDLQEQYDFSQAALKTSSGRLLLVWISDPPFVSCSYSDDNGYNWSDTVRVQGNNVSHQLSLTELEQGTIVFSYSSGSNWRTRVSFDNGENWSAEDYFNLPLFLIIRGNPNLIKLSESQDTLLGIFTSRWGNIYSIMSTNAGVSWGDTIRIGNTNINSPDPINNSVKALRDERGFIWLVYKSLNETNFNGYTQMDVSVLASWDNGITWQQQNNFTRYLGDDHLTGISSYGDDIFICYNSPRNKSLEQGFYGIINESSDLYTPPVLLSGEVVEANYETGEFVYNALIVDDEGVQSVSLNLEEGSVVKELYDDGLHNDSLANDNIFGNTFPILIPTTGNSSEDVYAVEINKISLPLNDKGIIADIYKLGYDLVSEITMTDIQNNSTSKSNLVEVPFRNPGSAGRYEEGHFLFSGGFILSGITNGEMWSNGAASAMLVEDYLSGNIGSDPKNSINRLYIVNKNDVPFGYTWQNWKDAVQLGAEFYDGDGDGIYNPVDKNWNGTWELNEDMPLLIGDETVWCVYNDGVPSNLRRWNTTEPQGIEIRQTLFAADDPELENVIFIRYSILNTGLITKVMDSVYFGIWEDGDLGDHTDDVVGCDTLLSSGFYYNNDHDWVYGVNCPAFFTTFLQGPIITTNNSSDSAFYNFGELIGNEIFTGSKNLDVVSHVFFIGGDPNLNDPGSILQARNYLEGKTRIGEYPDPCTFPHCEVRGGVNCSDVNPKFWASGDPVTDIGWLSRMNVDERNLISTGPFKLEKDKPQEIIIAYVIGRGTDYFNSITVARENVQRAIQEYQNNFSTMTYSAPPPTNPVTSYVLYQNYPNPFNPNTTIRYEIPQDGIVTIDIYDILGQKVKTILNEFQQANRYEVDFNAIGIASGIYIYQLRVNDFISSKKMVLIK